MKKIFFVLLFMFSCVFGVEELRKACDNNDWDACVNLGIAYYKGEGVEQDYEEAHTLYEWACDKGNNLEGCFKAGTFYAIGQGTEHNNKKALSYLKKACDSGLRKACNMHERILSEEKE